MRCGFRSGVRGFERAVDEVLEVGGGRLNEELQSPGRGAGGEQPTADLALDLEPCPPWYEPEPVACFHPGYKNTETSK